MNLWNVSLSSGMVASALALMASPAAGARLALPQAGKVYARVTRSSEPRMYGIDLRHRF